MGIVNPGKLPKKMRRRDNPDEFDVYAKGGQVEKPARPKRPKAPKQR